MLFFCEGVLIARFQEKIREIRIKKNTLAIVSILSLLAYCIVLCRTYYLLASLVISPLFFIIVYKANEVLPEKGIINTVMVRLGDISFSIYLVHLVVIQFLFNQCGIVGFVPLLCISLMITLAFSFLSYYIVEKKFIDLGKKMSAKL